MWLVVSQILQRDKDKLTDSDLIEKYQSGYARRDGPLLCKHVLAS